jgi:hypothetical protein
MSEIVGTFFRTEPWETGQACFFSRRNFSRRNVWSGCESFPADDGICLDVARKDLTQGEKWLGEDQIDVAAKEIMKHLHPDTIGHKFELRCAQLLEQNAKDVFRASHAGRASILAYPTNLHSTPTTDMVRTYVEGRIGARSRHSRSSDLS